MPQTYFSEATFRFQRDLAANNNRAWFAANKARYEEVLREPFLRLITDLQAPLAKISAHYRADPRPQGGSLFRIYRDTRFASDKTPYKTWAGARFAHERRREVEAPSFYLHIQPRDCFAGGGIWHPESPTLKKIREFLADNPAAWKKAVRAQGVPRAFRVLGRKPVATAARLRSGARADRRPQAQELRRRRRLRRCARHVRRAAAGASSIHSSASHR